MISTESKLWRSLKERHEHEFKALERLESPITLGCSDVIYRATRAAGFIELKTCNTPPRGKPFYLHSPFTLAQSTWLCSFHNPKQSLYSYLLIAVIGVRTWKEFLLIEPQSAMFLLAGWRGVAHEKFLKKRGIFRCEQLENVVQIITDRKGVKDKS
jgi:hypothetical protein